MNWGEFFAMGGYAVYVWPSYGLVLVALLVHAWLPWRRRQRLLRSLPSTPGENS